MCASDRRHRPLPNTKSIGASLLLLPFPVPAKYETEQKNIVSIPMLQSPDALLTFRINGQLAVAMRVSKRNCQLCLWPISFLTNRYSLSIEHRMRNMRSTTRNCAHGIRLRFWFIGLDFQLTALAWASGWGTVGVSWAKLFAVCGRARVCVCVFRFQRTVVKQTKRRKEQEKNAQQTCCGWFVPALTSPHSPPHTR